MTGHNVTRWHASPVEALRLSGDTIEAHQNRCADLIRDLWPDAPDTLINAARNHDEPEKWLGDLPFTTKRDFPKLAKAYRIAEMQVIKRHNIPQPTDEWERKAVKLVDRLDAYLWMMQHAPERSLFDDWIDAYNDLHLRAMDLDVSDKFRDMIGLHL